MRNNHGGKATRLVSDGFPVAEDVVGGGDMKPAKKWKVEINHDRLNRDDAENGYVIEPVGHIDLGGNSHEADGTKLRTENTQACRPPGNTPACEEEILRTFFASREKQPNADERAQINDQRSEVPEAERF